MYMVEKSGKLLCRIVLIMLLFVLCFCASCGHKEARYALDMAEKRMWDEPDSALKVFVHLVVIKRQDMHWIWQKNECGMNRILL